MCSWAIRDYSDETVYFPFVEQEKYEAIFRLT